MGNNNELEKKFSEDIDRLLAGREPAPGADDDTRTALEFARKMASLRAEPSAAFKTRLQNRLMAELERKEAQKMERSISNRLQEALSRLMTRQPVWQAATAVIVLIAVISGVVWGINTNRAQAPAYVSTPTATQPAVMAPTTATTAPSTTMAKPTTPAVTTAAPTMTKPPATGAGALLTAAGMTDKSNYQTGEVVNIQVTLKNNSAQEYFIDSFPPIVSVMDDGTKQPVRTFLGGTVSRAVPAYGDASFSIFWDGKDDNGKPVPGGGFYLSMENINHNRADSLAVQFSQPVRWSILTAAQQSIQSSGTRVIRPEISRTAGGLTMVLATVEISDIDFKVYAYYNWPEGYTPPYTPGQVNVIKPVDYTAKAQYYIDGGWVQDAGPSEITYYDRRTGWRWDIMDRIPADAAELLFIITKIEDREGPWEFRVTLQ